LASSITVKYADNVETLALGAGGTLTTEAIDDVLALTFVYPNCKIALTLAPIKGVDFRSVDPSTLVHADAAGSFKGLQAGAKYFAFVVEDGEEKAKYEEAQKRRAAEAAKGGAGAGAVKSGESCSCIEGNACAVPDNCKDWDNRLAVAARVMDEKKRRK